MGEADGVAVEGKEGVVAGVEVEEGTITRIRATAKEIRQTRLRIEEVTTVEPQRARPTNQTLHKEVAVAVVVDVVGEAGVEEGTITRIRATAKEIRKTRLRMEEVTTVEPQRTRPTNQNLHKGTNPSKMVTPNKPIRPNRRSKSKQTKKRANHRRPPKTQSPRKQNRKTEANLRMSTRSPSRRMSATRRVKAFLPISHN